MLKWLIVLVCVAVLLIFILKQRLSAKQNQPQKRHVSYGYRRPQVIQEFIDQDELADREVDAASDQLRFDQVSALLFENKVDLADRQAAEQIQYWILNKMPAQCLSQIETHELHEWSIYWSYKQQSLEYYVGRYGVFCTHVDRFGHEHKSKIREQRFQ